MNFVEGQRMVADSDIQGLGIESGEALEFIKQINALGEVRYIFRKEKNGGIVSLLPSETLLLGNGFSDRAKISSGIKREDIWQMAVKRLDEYDRSEKSAQDALWCVSDILKIFKE